MRVTTAIVAALLAAACAVGQQTGIFEPGPFTRHEAELMSIVWPQIRQAEDYEDINWQAHGLDRAPGDAEARRLMASNWDALRQAERFSDIDWERATGFREAARRPSAWQEPAIELGPFTREEAELMAAVWPDIRQAAAFEDIDWQAVGLEVAPGDAEARILMSAHWDELRTAQRFTDIDWEATTGYRGR